MLFNSLEYLFFLGIIYCLYIFLPSKYRKYLLLIASLLFYASHQVSLIIVLLVLIVFNYLLSIKINRKEHSKRKYLLILGIAANVLILCFYKYVPSLKIMFFNSANSSEEVSWIVPLGLSFIIFQIISYLVDCYKGNIESSFSFSDFALYVSFFPKVIQGPIVKSRDFIPQIKNAKISKEMTGIGSIKIIYGLFMKMVIADRLALLVNHVYASPREFSGSILILATCLYGIQLYFDFAGYSLIAIGSSNLFGYDIKSNFDRPYLSTSVSEFWRRWHISLNEWLMEYIYIPLGGSRSGIKRYIINILITFAISGIWHGSTMAFLIWGLLNGIYIIFEKLFSIEKLNFSNMDTQLSISKIDRLTLRIFLRRVYVFIMISITWLFFRSGNILTSKLIVWRILNKLEIRNAINQFAEMITLNDSSFMGSNSWDWLILIIFLIFGILFDILTRDKQWELDLYKKPIWVKWPILYLIIFVIIIFGIYGYGYNANSFIYQQF